MRFLLLLLLLTLPLPGLKAGEEINAATLYRQAFAKMPPLSPEEKAWFKNVSKGPLPQPAASELIKRFTPSLDTFVVASRIPKCDWELDYTRGPNLEMPHLTQAIALEGEAALTTIPDPSTGAPFTYRKDPKGFTLSTTAETDKRPNSIAFR